MIEDRDTGHLARRNEQKFTRGGHAGRIHTQTAYRAGMSKKSHDAHSMNLWMCHVARMNEQKITWADTHVQMPVNGDKSQPLSFTHCAQE